MIRIAVADDDSVMQESICRLIEKTVGKDKGIQIICFEEGKRVLEILEKGEKIHILLADIEMEPMNGIELGKAVALESPDTHLVYLTAYPAYASESYKLDAYQYILKEDMEKRLPEIVRRLVAKIKKEENGYRIFSSSGELERLYYKNIILMQKEKNRKYLQYVTVHGTYRERVSLDEVLEETDGHTFIRVGRSLAINLDHIDRIRDGMIFMASGEQIEVSRARMREVKEQISSFWREQ